MAKKIVFGLMMIVMFICSAVVLGACDESPSDPGNTTPPTTATGGVGPQDR